ncbi:hypothetical protein KPL70_020995 [Citrus sinensis]|nr:hypothetical protein KPL70_020995 [Citrus sinensis]
MRPILLLSWPFLIPFLANYFGIQMVLVSGQCQSDQQSLLLQMKNSFILSNHSVYPSTKLSQWSSHQSSDCCDWSGVRCDEAGHVIGLDLSREPIIGGLENATGLFNLQYLQSLNLGFTFLDGFQIPSRLGNLTNLTCQSRWPQGKFKLALTSRPKKMVQPAKENGAVQMEKKKKLATTFEICIYYFNYHFFGYKRENSLIHLSSNFVERIESCEK